MNHSMHKIHNKQQISSCAIRSSCFNIRNNFEINALTRVSFVNWYPKAPSWEKNGELILQFWHSTRIYHIKDKINTCTSFTELLAHSSSFCHRIIDLLAYCHQSGNETEAHSSNSRHTHTHPKSLQLLTSIRTWNQSLWHHI